MTPEQRKQFVLDHRTAIFGYNRAKDGPAMSIVFYCVVQDQILVSTMAERAKAKAVARSPKCPYACSTSNGDFHANPIGVFVDPARIAELAASGEPFPEIHARAMVGELSPSRPPVELPAED